MKPALFYTFLTIFAATSLVTLLGLVGVAKVPDGYLKLLVSAFIIELGTAVFAVFRTANFFGEADQAGPLAKEVSGGWWQLVYNPPGSDHAMTYFSLSFPENRLHLEGRSYTRAGKEMARWSSHTGCLNPDTRELFYVWEGDELQNANIGKDFLGFGSMKFAISSEAAPADRGTGWFTSGNVSQGTALTKHKCEIWRVTDAERKKILSEGEAKTALWVAATRFGDRIDGMQSLVAKLP